MRNHDLFRLFGATVLAASSLLAFSTSANAFAGLSDKQKAHIEEYIHCKTLLLTDLAAFEAEQPPCGGTPNVGLKSLAPTGSGGEKYRVPECEHPSSSTMQIAMKPIICDQQ